VWNLPRIDDLGEKLMIVSRAFKRPLFALFATTTVALTAVVALAGCGSSAKYVGPVGTVYGPKERMGNGYARSYVVLDGEGRPSTFGVAMSEGAMQFLPNGPAPTFATEFSLSFPATASFQPFNHIALYYSQGHEPDTTELPHFHIDYLLITQDERDQILDTDPRQDVPPPPQFLPQDHVPLGLHLPQLGQPWVDLSAGIFHGITLDHNYNYGFFNGQMTFINCDVSQAFLTSKVGSTTIMKLPQQYQKPGYYPTKYVLGYDPVNKEYTSSIQGLVLRQ
jgi:hypothetical protein